MLDVYLCQDAGVAADLLTGKLNSVLDNMAPVRKIQTRTNFAPWMSADIKLQMEARDAAQKKAIDSNKEEDWEVYRKTRNRVTVGIKIG